MDITLNLLQSKPKECSVTIPIKSQTTKIYTTDFINELLSQTSSTHNWPFLL